MILKQLYEDFASSLEGIYNKSEASDIRNIVFEWAANIDRGRVLTNPEIILPEEIVAKINTALIQLKTNKPVQYITGEAWFYKLKLIVSPAVLIPRPETEELVEEALDFIKKKNNSSIIDIGTGSGCIPIAIKKNNVAAEVTAIDVSVAALAIAKQNAKLHNTNINFLEIDFLQESSWQSLSAFDVIISNPPYIPASEEKNMNLNVTAFEPSTALFVPDSQPYIFYEKIAAFAKDHLKENGKIFMETHEDHAQQVAKIFKSAGYAAAVKKDMSGKERMVMANRRPKP